MNTNNKISVKELRKIMEVAQPWYSNYCGLWSWWGISKGHEKPAKAFLHKEIRERLAGTAPAPSECGGIWYASREDAMEDLKRVVNDLIEENQ
jgi:hypothetical protein